MNDKILKPIMLQDNLGFGDFVACCPKCHKPIIVPVFSKTPVVICSYCEQKIQIFNS